MMLRILFVGMLVLSLGLAATPGVAADPDPLPEKVCAESLGVCVTTQVLRDPEEIIRDQLPPCTCDPIE